MILSDFQQLYAHHPQVKALVNWASSLEPNVKISGLSGSSSSLVVASLFKAHPNIHILVLDDADEAAYMYNDLKQILSPEEVFFYPSSFKRAIKLSQLDTSNEILRTEVMNHLANISIPCIVVTYPESLMQKVVSANSMKSRMLKIHVGESLGIDFIVEVLLEYKFERVDFVYEPGQFSVRGGIVDIFSFANELPYRCDFFGDEVESIRIFDIETQLSQEKKTEIIIIPDLQLDLRSPHVSFFEFIPSSCWFSFSNVAFIRERLNQHYDEALVKANETDHKTPHLAKTQITGDQFVDQVQSFRKMEWGEKTYF